MKNLKTKVVVYFLGGFMMPPITWLIGLVYYGIVSSEEVLSIAFSPILWGYVFLFFTGMGIYLAKKIRCIDEYLTTMNEDGLAKVQHSVCFIPKFFMIAIATYVLVGPTIVLIDQEFLSAWEVFYSELIAVPIVLLFAVPFLTYLMINLEKWTSPIPLAKKRNCLGMRTRLTINMVVSTSGVIILLFLFVFISVAMAEHDRKAINPDLIVERLSVLSVIGILVVLVSFISMLNQIVTPVMKTTERLQDISEGEGDLTQNLASMSRDEIGYLASAFNQFLAKIRMVIREAQEISGALAESANQMATNVGFMSENAQGQAASTEQISATVEELSAGMDNVNANAQGQLQALLSLTEKMSLLSKSILDMGQLIVQTTQETEKISQTARTGEVDLAKMNESMSKITQGSSEMKGIVEIIDSISEQTNLLSLNASIEAARAGDAGRGFAVVADEISKLADQTASSLKEIRNLIEVSASEITTGMAHARETTNKIHTIVQGVAAIKKMMEQVSSQMREQESKNREVNQNAVGVRNQADIIRNATEEQKIATVEIGNSISNINQLTQANAHSSTEMAANAGGVLSGSQKLKEKVDFFKV